MDNLRRFIEALPLDADQVRRRLREEGFQADVPTPDISKLPDGVVNASTIVSFDPKVSPTLRSSVVLSLLAAEKVADTDKVATSPRLWTNRYTMILKGLGWLTIDDGSVEQEVEVTSGSVHDAIIPFLTVALGAGATATSLILTAINQLDKMSEAQPWIALYEREARRMDVSEYRFATVDDVGGSVVLKMAAARFTAQQDNLQILFFKSNTTTVRFQVGKGTLAVSTDLLEKSREPLLEKLGNVIEGTLTAIPKFNKQ